MKIPSARKLPSGSWFCRICVDGHVYAVTMPTQEQAVSEALAIKSGLKEAQKAPKSITLEQACVKYCADREAILSPSTVRGYIGIYKNRMQRLMRANIYTITAAEWQRAVSEEARMVSGKTMRNTVGFYRSVLKANGTTLPELTMPQIIKTDVRYLLPEEIPKFVDAVMDTKIEMAALLALHGLRRSEIMGLRISDIDIKCNAIRIRGAAVLDKNNTLVRKKETKNSTSRRDVPIMIPRLIDVAIAEKSSGAEYAVSTNINSIYGAINRICRKNSLPEIGVHGLRHTFASLCYHLGVSEKTAMQLGGWSDYGTMRKIYTHLAATDLQTQIESLQKFYAEPKTSRTKNGNENGNKILNPAELQAG